MQSNLRRVSVIVVALFLRILIFSGNVKYHDEYLEHLGRRCYIH